MFRPLNALCLGSNTIGGMASSMVLVQFFLQPASPGQRFAVGLLFVAWVLGAVGGWQEGSAARRLSLDAWIKTLPTVELTEEEAERLGFKKKKDDA